MEHKGGPTVILAKTIKGYGLGEAGEGRNISHQQKKMNEKELREFRARFGIPISDEEVVETPFYRPAQEIRRRSNICWSGGKKLGGFIPKRVVKAEPLKTPQLEAFPELLKGSGMPKFPPRWVSSACSRSLVRDKTIGRHVVPIIPDEARTFGMDALFRAVRHLFAQGPALRAGGQGRS